MRADRDDEGCAEDDPDGGPGQRAQDRPARAECIGAEHGQRPEHDPEAVLEAAPLGDVDRDGKPGRAAEAVAEPDRSRTRMLDGEPLGRLERRARRSAGVPTSHVQLVELRRVRTGREERIARNLPSRVRERSDPERRLQRGPERLVVRNRRQLRDPSCERLRQGLSRIVEPVEVGPLVPTVQSRRARAQNGDRGRHRLGVLLAAQRESGHLSRRCEEGQEPVELVDERGERGGRPRRSRRPVRRREEAPSEAGDSFPGRMGATTDRCSVPGELVLCELGECVARARSFTTERGTRPCRPEQRVRADPRQGGERPAFQARRDGRDRRRDRHGKDEREQRRRPRRSEVAVDHPREEDREPDRGHGGGSEPVVP